MRRFKRRKKFTWFPTLGEDLTPGEGSEDGFWYGQASTLTVPASGTQSLAIVPLTVDSPTENPGIVVNATLSDAIGSEWFLERLVGKFECRITTGQESVTTEKWRVNNVVGFGIFVARADFSQPEFPIGDGSDLVVDYSPLNINCIREPWLFHRTWNMGTTLVTGGALATANRAQSVNGEPQLSGSILSSGSCEKDGGVIDTSSVRRIGQDDRLYAAIAAQALTFDAANPITATTPGLMYWTLALRILGQLRRPKIQGKF